MRVLVTQTTEIPAAFLRRAQGICRPCVVFIPIPEFLFAIALGAKTLPTKRSV